MRPTIYQLFVRHFGNTNTHGVVDGSIEQNGCGKFTQITEKALLEIQKMGFTHVWFTGVLEQVSATSYPHIPADSPVLLKGKAGSPYAIRDYFDVSADYAVEPENRLEEFAELLDRCRELGLKTLIDFVPNHVARSYHSDIQPELNFGESDDVSQFFDWDNNFYYLDGEGPIELPGGTYPAEKHGRVTGNNAATWQPSLSDWYETVKLNYGHDFTMGRDTHELPEAHAHLDEVPDTWVKMDAILAYWQEIGVDGFRCDMAHMVPIEFWAWATRRARLRDPQCYFMAEAYDGDPAKLTHGNVLEALLSNGFDTVYDGDSYELVKHVIEGDRDVRELDELLWATQRREGMLRYAENHDEVRLASSHHWLGKGAKLGKVITAFLSGVGPSPFMLYNGQEVGEVGDGAEGFAKDDGRSSIFDYGYLPALSKWVNGGEYDGGGLTSSQRELRDWYTEWMALMQEPAFRNGGVYGLNSANLDNPAFRAESGSNKLYAFIRHDRESDEAFLVVLNFCAEYCARDVEVILPSAVGEWLEGEVANRVLVGGIEAGGVAVIQLSL